VYALLARPARMSAIVKEGRESRFLIGRSLSSA
jgi:hypothetical protein